MARNQRFVNNDRSKGASTDNIYVKCHAFVSYKHIAILWPDSRPYFFLNSFALESK